MRRPGDIIIFPRTNVKCVLLRQRVFTEWEVMVLEDPNGNHPQGAILFRHENELRNSVKGQVITDGS